MASFLAGGVGNGGPVGGQVRLSVLHEVLHAVVVQRLAVRLQLSFQEVGNIFQGGGFHFFLQFGEFRFGRVPRRFDLRVLGQFVLELVQSQVHVAFVRFQLLLEFGLLGAERRLQLRPERLPFLEREFLGQFRHSGRGVAAVSAVARLSRRHQSEKQSQQNEFHCFRRMRNSEQRRARLCCE